MYIIHYYSIFPLFHDVSHLRSASSTTSPRGALPSHSDLRHEAHVQHPIGFVQHEIAHAAETLRVARCGQVQWPDVTAEASGHVWSCICF